MATFKDCDIMLCKGTDFVSYLIRWGTNSKYSHVAVLASAKLQLVIEAVPKGGVRAICIENYKTEYDLYRVKEGNAFRPAEVTAFLIRMLARNYDFLSAVCLGWKMFKRKIRLFKLAAFKMTGQKEKADCLQEDQDYFCSELVYEAFKEGGLDIVPQIGEAETTSPGDIAKSAVLAKIA